MSKKTEEKNTKVVLCIDTNVYLSFYHFSDNDLEKLENILGLIDTDQLTILLPEQIINEFYRNRENKIKDAIKKLKEQHIDLKLPRISDSYEEKAMLHETFREFSHLKNQLIEKVSTDAAQEKLKADILLKKIFSKATQIPLTEELREKAKKRFDLGNPPGKNNSYGDAIIWESLLEYAKNDTDSNIHLVSIDGDFSCPLDEKKLMNFLEKESESYSFLPKKGKIVFYNALNDFFAGTFPDITLNEEYFKEKHIQDLEESYSFARTRKTLIKLEKYGEFSIDQVNRIVDAAISNSQIIWIKDYSDWVPETLINLVRPHYKNLEVDKLIRFLDIYNPEESALLKEEIMSEIDLQEVRKEEFEIDI